MNSDKMSNNTPRTIVVTGITKGIGRAIAERFAAGGWAVAGCARSESGIAELAGLHPDWHLAAVDVTRSDDLRTWAQELSNKLTGIDVLVNNAGVFRPGHIHSEPEGSLEFQLQTNLLSVYHLTRAILPGMMARQSGTIINLCSTASHIAYPNGGSYCVTKFALLGMTKVLREEMKPYGVRVVSLSPGATYTDSWSGSGVEPERLMPAESIAEMAWLAAGLDPRVVIEDLICRPQLGDLA
jgi:short-subunit dehydrogenase